MVQVRKKEKESIGMLLRRFTRRIQRSRILIRARSIRYRMPTRSDRERREEALRIREANAAQAQEDALKYGIKKKNWPICCPITHHDIAGNRPCRK